MNYWYESMTYNANSGKWGSALFAHGAFYHFLLMEKFLWMLNKQFTW